MKKIRLEKEIKDEIVVTNRTTFDEVLHGDDLVIAIQDAQAYLVRKNITLTDNKPVVDVLPFGFGAPRRQRFETLNELLHFYKLYIFNSLSEFVRVADENSWEIVIYKG